MTEHSKSNLPSQERGFPPPASLAAEANVTVDLLNDIAETPTVGDTQSLADSSVMDLLRLSVAAGSGL